MNKLTRKFEQQSGYTLIELLIVMAIFIVVIMITTDSFDTIASSMSIQTKSARSKIEGLVGLELLRADLASTGFGLPWDFTNPVNADKYKECRMPANSLVPGIDSAADFNDRPKPPRAIFSKAGTSGVDYLVIKSTNLSNSGVGKKWGYVNFSAGKGVSRLWSNPDDNPSDGDVLITIESKKRSSGEFVEKNLVVTPTVDGVGGDYYYTRSGLITPDGFAPGDEFKRYLVYGVLTGTSTNKDLSMPFNRVDYYIKRTADVSPKCASGTGNLYRGLVSHSDGTFVGQPLLDCVLDMQVVYWLYSDDVGSIVYTDSLAALDAAQIRDQIKAVHVYLLAQEGGEERGYSYPFDTIQVGPEGLGKTWSNDDLKAAVGDKWRNYRWKVYEVSSQLKNLSN